MNRKFPIFNLKLSEVDIDSAFKLLEMKSDDKSEYILFPDLSVLSLACSDTKLAQIINDAFLAMPDGKPSEFIAKIKGYRNVKTVSGYHLILRLLKESDGTHYFYGSTDEKLDNLKLALSKYDPSGNKILGYRSAPFVKLDEIEKSDQIISDFNEINKFKADYIWVGIGSPKQDYLLYHHSHRIDKGYVLGVGGVFEYLSGDINISPEWIKKIGFRWLYRLSKEPKRLFPKYFRIFTNLSRYYISKIT